MSGARSSRGRGKSSNGRHSEDAQGAMNSSNLHEDAMTLQPTIMADVLAPDTPEEIPPLDPAIMTMPSMSDMQLLAEAAEMNNAQRNVDTAMQDDDRSSSLSDVEAAGDMRRSSYLSDEDEEEEEGDEEEDEDVEGSEGADAIGSEEENEMEDMEEDPEAEELDEDPETEAETERIDPSPEKARKSKNLVLSSSTERRISGTHNAGEMKQRRGEILANGDTNPMNDGDQSSEISPAEESDNESSRSVSPGSISSLKRKRATIVENGEEDIDSVRARKRAVFKLGDRLSQGGALAPDVDALIARESFEHPEDSDASENEEEAEAQKRIAPVDEVKDDEEPADIEDKDVDDVEMEEAHAEADLEATARTEEELAKKKAALDKLSAIEKHFATLRDKLFEERSFALNEELAMLQAPKIIHPEYLAMLAVIDQRRNDKMEQAQIRRRYDIQTLKNKSVAERIQCHSQYMQTVRELRDKVLEDANKEWYELRFDKGNQQEDAASRILHLPPTREMQYSNQTAYNTEVSILSGIAKYVGFPAAPEIKGATVSEMEDDMRKMGLTPQHAPARIPVAFPRPRAAAEEQFLEQTPWANPQHPVHAQAMPQILNNAHRHVGTHSRPHSPFTPAMQGPRRDMTTVQQRNVSNVSNSTIPMPLSAQNSSAAPTPMSAEPSRHAHNPHLHQPPEIPETPSKPFTNAQLPPNNNHFLHQLGVESAMASTSDSMADPGPSTTRPRHTSNDSPYRPKDSRYPPPASEPDEQQRLLALQQQQQQQQQQTQLHRDRDEALRPPPQYGPSPAKAGAVMS